MNTEINEQNAQADTAIFEQPVERPESHTEVSSSAVDPAPRHEISDEDRDDHVASLRQLVQQIRNRNDQDTNRVLDNMMPHLNALDGNPEEREAQRVEAEQAKAWEEKRLATESDEARAS